MNDLFRAIFGVPRDNQHGERMDDRIPKEYSSNFRGNMGDDDDDDDDEDHGSEMRRGFGGGFFGFPLFSDPNQIHKHFERLADEMHRAFGVFGFHNGPSITWDNEGDESSFFRDQPQPRQESLRDAYLKKPTPECNCVKINQNNDFNFGSSSIKPKEYKAGTSGVSVKVYPNVYSQSVYIQTVKRPDGSVEIIRKVTDHEGNEETTITHSNVNEPLPPQQDGPVAPKEDTSGLSIFKKFFSF